MAGRDKKPDGRTGGTAVVRALTDDPDSGEIRTREATLLFSDIVGITPFFDRFGDRAGHARIRTHNELLFPVIQAQRGRVVKTIGDAIMAVFDAPGDGVAAAVEMQRSLAAHNRAQTDPDARIAIRIGLHSGPAIIDQADVFGDAVNVAARISSEAAGDQILISAETLQGLPAVHSPTHLHTRTWLKGKDTITEIHEVDWRPAQRRTAQAEASRPVPADEAEDPDARSSRPRLPWMIGLLAAGLAGLLFVVWSETGQQAAPPPSPAAEPEPFQVPPAPPSPEPAQLPTPTPPQAAPDMQPPPPQPGPDKAPLGGQKADAQHRSKPAASPRTNQGKGRRGDASKSPALAFFRATQTVDAHMKRLELRPGDLPDVDFLRGQAAQLGRSGEYEKALRAAKRAARRLAHFRLSKQFVTAKLHRMQARFGCRSGAGNNPGCQGVVDQVNMLISRGRLRGANTLINEAAADMRARNGSR